MWEIMLFVGAYTEPIKFGTGEVLEGRGSGIRALRLREDGAVSPLHLTPGVRNPSYITYAPKRRVLYCTNELKEYDGMPGGAVSAFSVDRASGALSLLNRRASGGGDPCHLAVDARERHLVVSNFMDGSVAVFPLLDTGALGERSFLARHEGGGPHPVRQKGPHAHAAVFSKDDSRLLAPDLGCDKVFSYRLDGVSGELRPCPPHLPVEPGQGPRHGLFNAAGDRFYLLNELGCSVFVYRYSDGVFSRLQSCSTLPGHWEGENIAAAVRLSPDGRFLYCSNRGHDSIAVFRIGTDGLLFPEAFLSTGGKTPRDFVLTPDGGLLIAAHQDSDDLRVYNVDRQTGLFRLKSVIGTPTPTCIEIGPEIR